MCCCNTTGDLPSVYPASHPMIDFFICVTIIYFFIKPITESDIVLKCAFLKVCMKSWN